MALKACGRSTWRIIGPCRMPMDNAASVWPAGNDANPARMISAKTAPLYAASARETAQNGLRSTPSFGMPSRPKNMRRASGKARKVST